MRVPWIRARNQILMSGPAGRDSGSQATAPGVRFCGRTFNDAYQIYFSQYQIYLCE